MSVEAAAVVWRDGSVTLHEPDGRSAASIPDTRSLWDLCFGGRDRLAGIAHTHPGSGYPSPSREDLTTFAAMEKGLGRRIRWWILSRDSSVLLERSPKNPGYDVTDFLTPDDEPAWMEVLRAASYP